MELFYTMNKEIIKEIKRIILCQKVKEDEKNEEDPQNDYEEVSK